MNNIICHNVINTSKGVIILEYKKKELCIHFDDCAKNFAVEQGIELSKCVAMRDITSLSFIFYTLPKTKVIFKKHLIKDLIREKSAVQKFLDLQNAIIEAGYTSYDLS